jgi:diguanylate cyclase (GGDEF)-like protein
MPAAHRITTARRFQLFGLLLFGTLAVAYLDYLTDEQLSLYVLFVPLVALAAWHLGFAAAAALALVSSILWVIDDYFVPHKPMPDIAKYWGAVVRFVVFSSLAYPIVCLRASRHREHQLASHDVLTGLANRRLLFGCGQQKLERAKRLWLPVTAIFLDCDGFKEVNDRWGHTVGDSVLRLLAQTLTTACQPGDLVARFGGDEFVVLSDADAQTGEVTARRIFDSLNTAMRDHGWAVTFSIGGVTFQKPPSSLDELLNAADDIMYAVKHTRKDGVEFRTRGESSTAKLHAT